MDQPHGDLPSPKRAGRKIGGSSTFLFIGKIQLSTQLPQERGIYKCLHAAMSRTQCVTCLRDIQEEDGRTQHEFWIAYGGSQAPREEIFSFPVTQSNLKVRLRDDSTHSLYVGSYAPQPPFLTKALCCFTTTAGQQRALRSHQMDLQQLNQQRQ